MHASLQVTGADACATSLGGYNYGGKEVAQLIGPDVGLGRGSRAAEAKTPQVGLGLGDLVETGRLLIQLLKIIQLLLRL